MFRAVELTVSPACDASAGKFKAAQIALDRIPADNEGREFLGDLMDDLESVSAAGAVWQQRFRRWDSLTWPILSRPCSQPSQKPP